MPFPGDGAAVVTGRDERSRAARGGPQDERERLIGAITELAAKVGYRHVTPAAIAARAGVAEADFDRHFADTEACFLAAWDRVNECFGAALVRAFSEADTWRDGLRNSARETMRLVREHPDQGRVFVVEVHAAGGEAMARRDLTMGAIASMVDSVRPELDDPSVVRRSTAEAIVGGFYNNLYVRLVRGAGPDFADLVPEMMCTAVTPYLGVEAGLEELRRE